MSSRPERSEMERSSHRDFAGSHYGAYAPWNAAHSCLSGKDFSTSLEMTQLSWCVRTADTERVREPRNIDQPNTHCLQALPDNAFLVQSPEPGIAGQKRKQTRIVEIVYPHCGYRAGQGTHEYRPAQHELPPGAAWPKIFQPFFLSQSYE